MSELVPDVGHVFHELLIVVRLVRELPVVPPESSVEWVLPAELPELSVSRVLIAVLPVRLVLQVLIVVPACIACNCQISDACEYQSA